MRLFCKEMYVCDKVLMEKTLYEKLLITFERLNHFYMTWLTILWIKSPVKSNSVNPFKGYDAANKHVETHNTLFF